ncbi:LPS-assembly protein LptD [compost metagenome]
MQTDQIGVESKDYVNQQGAVSYRGDNYVARVNAQAYQMATISKITPYNRLPQITFNGELPQHPYGLDFAYKTELV